MERELPHSRRSGASPATRMLVSSTTNARNSGAKTTVAVIFSSVATVLALTALIVASAPDPPPLVWVRFAIGSTIVFGLAILATVVFERMR